jgi:hypothetical protein
MSRLAAALLFLAFSTFYLATRTHYNTFDAVSYANQIERLYPRTHDLKWLFHPHHLLFNFTGYMFFHVIGAFGWRGNVLTATETLNALVAAWGIAEFFLLIRARSSRATGIALLGAAALGVSYGYWVAATDGRVNMISAVLLIAAYRRFAELPEQPLMRRQALTAGFLAGMAVLYHESAALFLPGLFIASFLRDKATPTRRKSHPPYRDALAVLAAWAGTVGGAYLIVGAGVLRLHSLAAFRGWAEKYAELGWWWDFRVGHNLPLDLFAAVNAVVATALPHRSFGPFVRGCHHAAVFGCGVVFLTAAIAAVVLIRSEKRFVVQTGIWIAAYAAFFTVWTPGYFIFWIPVTIAVLALALSGAARLPLRFPAKLAPCAALVIWIASVATWNWHAQIQPHIRRDASPYQRVAREIGQHTQPGDLIVITGEGDLAECEVNIPYFADRDTIALHTEFARHHEDAPSTVASVQGRIADTLRQGHGVYVLDEAWHRESAVQLLGQRHPEATMPAIDLLFSPWKAHAAWRGGHGPVWQLVPRSSSFNPVRRRAHRRSSHGKDEVP